MKLKNSLALVTAADIIFERKRIGNRERNVDKFSLSSLSTRLLIVDGLCTLWRLKTRASSSL